MLEELLAYHCAPAFAGIKPANIVSCSKEKYGSLHRDIETLNRQLNPKDIFIRILCECERRALVMVYRKSILTSHLQTECNKLFLCRYGYPQDGTLSDYLEILSTRLDCESFPHEIGVFLGYPLYDIDCFIHHRDEGCLLVGEWKVYRNKEEAEKMFRRFRACRKALSGRVTGQKKTLAQVFCAV